MPSQALFGKAGDAGARQPNQVYAAMAGARWGDGLGRAWLRYVQAGTGAFSSQASPADLPSVPTIGVFVFVVPASYIGARPHRPPHTGARIVKYR